MELIGLEKPEAEVETIRTVFPWGKMEADPGQPPDFSDTDLSAWLDGEGIAIRGLRTPYGALGYRLRRADGQLALHVEAGLAIPPGGIVLRWPLAGQPGAARLNGRPVPLAGGAVTIRKLPATVTIQLPTEALTQ